MSHLTLRRLSSGELGQAQAVIESASDYYESVYGHPPGPGEAARRWNALPEGATSDAKLFLGLWTDHRLIGIADIVRGWPRDGTWMLGLMLLIPESRGRGIGSEAITHIEAWARSYNAEHLRIAIRRADERGFAFWTRRGFRRLDDESPTQDPIRLLKPVGRAHRLTG